MPDPVDPDPYRDTFTALAELTRNTARLHALAANALAALQAEAGHHDSHRTVASGRATDTRGGSEHTRVEAAMLHRLGDPDHPNRPAPTAAAWEIYDWAITARDATRQLMRAAIANINRTNPNPPYLTATEKRRLYCIGDGTEESAGCHDYGTIDGRCERHALSHRAVQRALWAWERRRRRHR
jgi:hypothetical protein